MQRSGRKQTCTRVSTAGLACLCKSLASLGPGEVNFTLLTVQNDVSWGLPAISKDIYNYPAVKDHRKAARSFLRTRKPSPGQTDGVTTQTACALGLPSLMSLNVLWAFRASGAWMCSGPSEPQEPECALGLPSLRSLKPWGEKVTAQKETWRFGDSVAGTRKEERPKEFSFLNTINHAQIPPKVISNHFKIWNIYNFHLVCMASSKDCLWRGELLRAVHLQS